MNSTVVGELAGQTLGGRYHVAASLARGGMATVYLATDTKLQRTVALKVLRPDLAADPDFMARFFREARATAALSHPNVVAVHDFDITDQWAYLVLEYVPGHTLRHLLTEHRLTPSQALAVIEPILEALIAAHESGIVHRDIKPENVLLGPRGLVKVADFGLARALDNNEHRTRTGLIIGTAAYVSPEHVSGTGTNAASDIYSTGILLFEMLTGLPPFTGENALSVAFQHVNSDVPRPSSRVRDLPSELDDLVLGATARDAGARFPNAASFLDEVRRVQAVMPPAEPFPLLQRHDDKPTVILSPGEPQDGDAVDDGAGSGTDSAVVSDEPPRRRRRRRGRMLLGFVLTLALLGGAAWAVMAGPLQRAPVPDLVGLSVDDAHEVLLASRLRLDVDAQEYSETAPKDTVIRQTPAAESDTFVRFPVAVVVSLGPERYAVPEVRGASVPEATAALQSTKLAVGGQSRAFDEAVAKDLIVGTDPAIGTSQKPQTPVTLIVSDGPAPRPVPDVTGQPLDDAKAAVEAAGLVVAGDDTFSETVAAGRVAAVAPDAGTQVEKGSTVTLTVSKGPPPVEVPRVVDMKRSDAVERLQSVGFKVRVQEGIVTPLDRVYSQDPPPGETLPKGSTVTISVF